MSGIWVSKRQRLGKIYLQFQLRRERDGGKYEDHSRERSELTHTHTHIHHNTGYNILQICIVNKECFI